MTDDILKPALVLKVLQSKILLSDNPQVNILIREFLDAGKDDGFTVSEVVTLLSRFQKRKLIKIIDIFTTREAVAMVDLATLAGSLMRENYNYNELEENQYSERSGFGCQVNAAFYDYLQKFLTDNTEAETILTLNPKLKQVLSPVENVLKLEIVFQEKPFVWYCPIDRSKVGEIKNKEDIERYLKDFARGSYPSCKDRRHKNRFWVTEKTISFGTLPMMLGDVFTEKVRETEKPSTQV